MESRAGKEGKMKRKITDTKSEITGPGFRMNWVVFLIIAVVALGAFGTGMSLLEQSA